MTETTEPKMIKLADGISINHKKKRYVGEIPEAVHVEIYGRLDPDEKVAKKLYEKQLKKHKWVEPKKEAEEPEVKK